MATYKAVGTSLFTSLTKTMSYNGRDSKKFELTITLDEGQVADVENLGIKLEDGTDWSVPSSEYNGSTQYKMKFKSQYKVKAKDFVDRNRVPYVDSDGLIKEVPKGSKVSVFFSPAPYGAFQNTPAGVTLYLNGIQIINEGGGMEVETFEDEVHEVADGEDF